MQGGQAARREREKGDVGRQVKGGVHLFGKIDEEDRGADRTDHLAALHHGHGDHHGAVPGALADHQRAVDLLPGEQGREIAAVAQPLLHLPVVDGEIGAVGADEPDDQLAVRLLVAAQQRPHCFPVQRFCFGCGRQDFQAFLDREQAQVRVGNERGQQALRVRLGRIARLGGHPH